MPQKIVITGGSGFIGSNLADALLRAGMVVTIADNFSTGHSKFIEDALRNGAGLLKGDLADAQFCREIVRGADAVVHLAANADVRFGWLHPDRDLRENIVVTHNLLEAMRELNVRRLVFSSTGSVYGESSVIPTPEDAPFPLQTSLYGASKVSAEALISAYAEAGIVDATIFRFVSILGPRYTHGHVLDFVAQLLSHPSRLRILGNGSQRKSYLHVDDCVRAIQLRLLENPKIEVLNLGTEEFCEVKDSARWIALRMGVSPSYEFTGGDRGWVGDNPFIFLDTRRIRNHGWVPELRIRSAVESTVDWILENRWVLDAANLDQ